MIGRILLDNESWLITLGLFGGIKVTLKNRGLTRRANRGERRYLMEMVETLEAAEIPIEPGGEPVEDMLNDFASAVFGGEARWTAFFALKPPNEKARNYIC